MAAKQGKFRYQVLSMRIDNGFLIELESSFGSRTESEQVFKNAYSKWGLIDTNFYLVDFEESRVLAKHEVFDNGYTKLFF